MMSTSSPVPVLCGELLVRSGGPFSVWEERLCCKRKSACGWRVRKRGKEFWQTFAFIYYREGEKYTLGTTFTSREEQGEFLFCLYDKVAPQHCEIICEEGKFWVRKLKRRNALTYVNGKAVEWNDRVEFKFGDVLSLGISGDSDKKKKAAVKGVQPVFKFEEREKHYQDLEKLGEKHTPTCRVAKDMREDEADLQRYRIRVRRNNLEVECRRTIIGANGKDPSVVKGKEKKIVKKETEEDADDYQYPMEQVVGNGLLLQNILSFLPSHELGTSRLVSSSWNKEVLLLWKKRKYGLTRVDLTNVPMHPFERRSSFMPISNENRLLTLASEMGGAEVAPFRKVMVNIPFHRTFFNPGFRSKFMDTLKWFFTPGEVGACAQPITRLIMEGPLDVDDEDYSSDNTQRQIWERVLSACGSELETLTLRMELDMTRTPPVPKPFAEEIQFPRLKSLALSPISMYQTHDWHGNITEDYHGKIKDWILRLMDSAPNVERLILSKNQRIERGFNNLVLQEIGKDKNRFPKLKGLSISRVQDETFQALLKLPQQIEELELHLHPFHGKERYDDDDEDDDDIDESEVDHVKDLSLYNKVLKKFASSLTGLRIELPGRKDQFDHITIPVLPKLKTLEIFGYKNQWNENGQSVGLQWEAGESLDYKKMFPQLKTLCIDPRSEEENLKMWVAEGESEPLLDAFFPFDGDQICETLRTLNVPYYHYPQDQRKKRRPYEGMQRITKMFPNVINKCLSDVRDEEKKKLEIREKQRKRKAQLMSRMTEEPMRLRPRRNQGAHEEGGDGDSSPRRNVSNNLRRRRRGREFNHPNDIFPFPLFPFMLGEAPPPGVEFPAPCFVQ